MEGVVDKILASMSTVKKPQRIFIVLLLSALVVVQGKANFRNMSRYSSMSEKRFSRWYRRGFDFAQFNTRLMFDQLSPESQKIAAMDASFASKSGKNTDGLGMFYHSSTGQAEKGLEISLISIIDLQSNTAYSLDARQTIDREGCSRVDLYVEQLTTIAPILLEQGIRHTVVDSYYAKEKFVTGAKNAELEVVGKLRVDANLRWLYSGDYSGRGRPKKYDGKVDYDKDLARFECTGFIDEDVETYTALVNCPRLNRTIRVVMLRIKTANKIGRALLYSTDTGLSAETIIAWYKARFQIEFVFRDAKQHTGLMDCQSCKKEAIHTHINASFTALNILKLEDLKHKGTQEPTVISITSWKRRKFNIHLLDRFIQELGLAREDKKVRSVYEKYIDYGAIAA